MKYQKDPEIPQPTEPVPAPPPPEAPPLTDPVPGPMPPEEPSPELPPEIQPPEGTA